MLGPGWILLHKALQHGDRMVCLVVRLGGPTERELGDRRLQAGQGHVEAHRGIRVLAILGDLTIKPESILHLVALELFEPGRLAKIAIAQPFQHFTERFAGQTVSGVSFLLLLSRQEGARLRPLERGPKQSLVDQPAEDEGRCSQGRDAQARRRRRMAPDPFHHPFRPGNRSREDRTALEKSIEIVGQRRGRRVAVRGVFAQAFQADRLDVARQSRLELPRRDGIGRTNLLERLKRRCGQKWRPARQHLVEDRPERVNIGRWPDRSCLSQALLRCHVAG